MKAIYQRMSAGDNRQALADVLSVLAMNAGAEGARECLNFRLAGSSETAGSWGHEYVRCADLPRDCRLRASLAPVLVWAPGHLGCRQCVCCSRTCAGTSRARLAWSGRRDWMRRNPRRTCWRWSTRLCPSTWRTTLSLRLWTSCSRCRAAAMPHAPCTSMTIGKARDLYCIVPARRNCLNSQHAVRSHLRRGGGSGGGIMTGTEPTAVPARGLQVEQLAMLVQYVDASNYGRACLYLVSTCAYLPPPDDLEVLLQVPQRPRLPARSPMVPLSSLSKGDWLTSKAACSQMSCRSCR